MPRDVDSDWRFSEFEGVDLDPLAIRVRLINLAHEHMGDRQRSRPIAEHIGKGVIPGEDMYTLVLDDRRWKIDVRMKELESGRVVIGVRTSRIVSGIMDARLLGCVGLAVSIVLVHFFMKLRRGDHWYEFGYFEARSVLFMLTVLIVVGSCIKYAYTSSGATREALRRVQEDILSQYA